MRPIHTLNKKDYLEYTTFRGLNLIHNLNIPTQDTMCMKVKRGKVKKSGINIKTIG